MTQLNKLPTSAEVVNSLKHLYIGLLAAECCMEGSEWIFTSPILHRCTAVNILDMGNKFESWSEANWVAVSKYDAELLKDRNLTALNSALDTLVI